jgi:hypothetical protein
MDFDHPWSLLSGLIIGLFGMGLLMYGKKQSSFRCIGVGLAMCIFPYFITSIAAMWLCTAACLGALWGLGKISN